MVLMSGNSNVKNVSETIKKVLFVLNMPLRWLSKYYSSVLEREVNMRQTKALTEAQLAFFALVMPADYSLLLRIAACIWFVLVLRRCRNLMK